MDKHTIGELHQLQALPLSVKIKKTERRICEWADYYGKNGILNNALENSIEACCKAEGAKQIKLRSYIKGSLFFIEVENDFSGEIVIKETGIPASSKETGKLHGIGISNIQRCAKKYMGDIDITISDTGGRKKFNLTIMMNGKPAAAN